MEFYISPQSGQFYMINVLENQWLSVTYTLMLYRVNIIVNNSQLNIFSRQASLARQAFLITPLHGARYKTGKNAYAKK